MPPNYPLACEQDKGLLAQVAGFLQVLEEPAAGGGAELERWPVSRYGRDAAVTARISR